MIRKRILIAAILLFVISGADTVVSLGRTRTVFDGSEKSMTLDISNDNKQLPYLVQVWIEDENQEKIITGPVIATPPVQRLEPGVKSIVRLNIALDISKSLQDRELLFYFNLQEIPPRSEKTNVLQIALQIKIKLFYRLTAIKTRPNEVQQDQSILNKVSGGYCIKNPTSYYVTVIGLGGSEKQAEEGEFETMMLSPHLEQTVRSANYNAPYLSYINDYDGRPVLSLTCNGGRCFVKKEK